MSSYTPSQGSCALVRAFFLELRCDLGALASAAVATVTIVGTPPRALLVRAS